MTKAEVIDILKAEIAKETGIPFKEIEDTSDFFSLGLDSIRAVYVLDQVEKRLKVELNPIYFWDYPTLDTFSDFVSKLKTNA